MAKAKRKRQFQGFLALDGDGIVASALSELLLKVAVALSTSLLADPQTAVIVSLMAIGQRLAVHSIWRTYSGFENSCVAVCRSCLPGPE